MRRQLVAIIPVAAYLLYLSAAFAGASITAAEAARHIGDRATVCGTVASTHFANRSRGLPTFLNLDRAYPNHIFTITIWGSDRGKFRQPEIYYRDKAVCVTGTIKSYRGKPEMIVRSPKQIELR